MCPPNEPSATRARREHARRAPVRASIRGGRNVRSAAFGLSSSAVAETAHLISRAQPPSRCAEGRLGCKRPSGARHPLTVRGVSFGVQTSLLARGTPSLCAGAQRPEVPPRAVRRQPGPKNPTRARKEPHNGGGRLPATMTKAGAAVRARGRSAVLASWRASVIFSAGARRRLRVAPTRDST